jgi:predicted nucleotidyltransferase
MIQTRTIKSIARTIAKTVKPHKIVLFGSYVGGKPTEDSDLDIIVIQDTNLPMYKRARGIHSLFNPYPCPMDILVYTPEEVEYWKDTPAAFVTRALRDGKVLYES